MFKLQIQSQVLNSYIKFMGAIGKITQSRHNVTILLERYQKTQGHIIIRKILFPNFRGFNQYFRYKISY